MEPGIAPASDQAIARAAQLLRDGELVASRTETVYGLGGDATSETAVARIFAAKGRPRFNPLIVHVPGLAEAEPLAVFDKRARDAARRFWPGPLTLVLSRRGGRGGCRCWPAPGWTRSPCAPRPIRSRNNCCARPASRSRRPRPTAPAGSARRMQPTSPANSALASR